ncbi:MAG TPA: thrombospondin type 3 repeat-containing protein [Candidatus Eisenbacteria bacterium]|nr:thrombospondin type 3 repeat-containing protein [Candidatus Eisenbacteria bacterium]
MDGYEYEEGSNKKKYVIIGIVAAALLLVIGIGVFVIVRRRAGETEPGPKGGVNAPVSGLNVNGAGGTEKPPTGIGGQKEAPEIAVAAMTVNQPLEAVAATSSSPQPPPTIIDPTMNRLLTDKEKLQLGYPLEWTVRVHAVVPKGGGEPLPQYEVVSKGTDTDGDGLSAQQERDAGTDPTKADTDGDGLTDGDEVSRGTDPTKTDTDGDGIDDHTEMEQKTLPPPPAPPAPEPTAPAPSPAPPAAAE